MPRSKLALGKIGVEHAVTWSVGFCVTQIVRNNVETQNPVQEAEVCVGAFVLGSMIGHAAGQYASGQIDELVASIEEAKAKA